MKMGAFKQKINSKLIENIKLVKPEKIDKRVPPSEKQIYKFYLSEFHVIFFYLFTTVKMLSVIVCKAIMYFKVFKDYY